MSDVLDDTGLSLKTLPIIVAELTASLQGIYGADINVDPDSTDGQAINIFAQAAIDLREILASIYSGLDPDQASGIVLDQRVANNGIIRTPGSFTIVPVDITVDRNVSLVGLDADPNTIDIPAGVFTIKDNAGTQFVLLTSVALTAGLHSLDFRAVNIGAVAVTVATITAPVTVVAGVTLINNSSGATSPGVDEETDAHLRIRREKSISNSASSFLDAIEGNLLAVSGVTAATVYENTTASTDSDGIPAHSIWAIVEGGSDADIAAMLFAKKSTGAGFKGSVSVNIVRPNGQIYIVNFDRPTDANLWIEFSLALPGGIIDTASIKALIVSNIVWGLGQDALADVVTSYVKSLNSNYRVTNMLLAADSGGPFLEIVPTPSKVNRFVMSTTRITIS
jgi:uncharacterized phage protein gp47/JayE